MTSFLWRCVFAIGSFGTARTRGRVDGIAWGPVGGFIAAFIISEFIAVGGSCFATEWGYAIAFLFFMVVIFIRPQGLFGGKS